MTKMPKQELKANALHANRHYLKGTARKRALHLPALALFRLFHFQGAVLPSPEVVKTIWQRAERYC